MTFFEPDKIVFKPLSYQELCISLERMLRFNNPVKKYDRVYREILIKHLFFPKISLKIYHEYTFEQINFLVQVIWNESVKKLKPEVSQSNLLNLYLLFEETKAFSAKEMIKKMVSSQNFYDEKAFLKIKNDDFSQYLENLDEYSKAYIESKMIFPINISGFLEIAKEQNGMSKNIQRICWLDNEIKNSNHINLEEFYIVAERHRKDSFAQKPIRLVIIAEGVTEEILLPVFASTAGFDFDQNGVQVIASGGKNQAAKKYREIYEEINLPIFIILDADAKEVADEIQNIILPKDKLYLISGGEFEDIIPDELVCRSVNSYYKNIGAIKKEDIYVCERKASTLADLWKEKGFGEFKKAEFAHIVSENIKTTSDLSKEMVQIISEIRNIIN
jgi:hypothetical protein